MERTLVIGDVHGCLAELDDLLAEAAPDHVVFVGDLVAKGPDSAGVVGRARELGARAVVGNHDLAALRAYRAEREGEPPPALRRDHQEVVDTLSRADFAWLDALPYWLRLPEHGALVVHAGLVPGVPLEAQDPGLMVTMRSVRPDGSGTKRLEDGVPWASLWPGPEHVLFGHDAVRGLQRHAHATGLDSGCVYGGRLTGCVLPGFELVWVPARRVYRDPMGAPE